MQNLELASRFMNKIRKRADVDIINLLRYGQASWS